MSPDLRKVQVVVDWPMSQKCISSRDWHFITGDTFSTFPMLLLHCILLHKLVYVLFLWNEDCTNAFKTLKQCLTEAPLLVYPCFSSNATEFVLQTDASALGLEAVLEQDVHPIVYASQSLTSSERNYSVIQYECLAIVFALKQFCHYLLGRPFHLYTDHAPLQWLSAQKMEVHMLCRSDRA